MVPPAGPEVQIGLLLPLSGPQAQLGSSMRDAALLALTDKRNTLGRNQMHAVPTLLLRDTAGDPNQAASMTQELINKGAKIILGPLTAEEVRTAGAVARTAKVPMISFSNNADVAKPGVFVFGFNPTEQVRRIADYALSQQFQQFAALAPQNEYGRMVVNDFSQAVNKSGKTLQPVNFFNEGETPPGPVTSRVISSAVEWGAVRKGILLPFSGAEVAETSQRLMSAENINPQFVKLLGTGLWDDARLLRVPSMQGAWFASAPQEGYAKFARHYAEVYKRDPNRMAGLSYDAVALAATLALDNATEPFTPLKLADPLGYRGPANGVYRLLSSGQTQRALAVLEITGKGFRVVDPAPTAF